MKQKLLVVVLLLMMVGTASADMDVGANMKLEAISSKLDRIVAILERIFPAPQKPPADPVQAQLRKGFPPTDQPGWIHCENRDIIVDRADGTVWFRPTEVQAEVSTNTFSEVP